MQIELIIERIKMCRQDLGITQQEAAKLIGVSQPAYQRYEAGLRTPSIQVAKEIAAAFNTSVDYLTGKSYQKNSDYITITRKDSPLLYDFVCNCKNLDEENLNRLIKYYNNLKL